MVGETVDGKYLIVGLLGEGGMGAVYEAQHTTTGRSVAVKVINDNAMMADEVLRARFQREAQAASKVRSAHIVEILDAGQDPVTKHPYMVMDLLQGENLLAVLKRLECLAPELVKRIGYQTCLGLSKAHDVGVVHRDIKPANLFLSDGEANEVDLKLLDFGVAKFKMDQATESANEALTRTGSMLGSPMYMSPEQARGLKTIDHRADIWSLGVVLYQLLAGHTPYHAIDGLGELIITICSEEPEPLRKRAPWVPQALADVVQKALKLSPEERYQSAQAFGEALLGLVPDGRWRIQRDMVVAADKGANQESLADALGDTVSLADVAASAVPAAGLEGGDSTVALEPHELPELSGVSTGPSMPESVDGEAATERIKVADVAAEAGKVVSAATPSAAVAQAEPAQAGVSPMVVAVLLLAVVAVAGYFYFVDSGSSSQAPTVPSSAATAVAKPTTGPKAVETAKASAAPTPAPPPSAATAVPSASTTAGASAASSAAPLPQAPRHKPHVLPGPLPAPKTYVPDSP